jgi:hypothetical protein
MPNLDLLGLPPLDPAASFMETFEAHFAPRLAHRADGFRVIFTNLNLRDPYIVETGCLRALGNWSGDGQSTFMFDLFTQEHNGLFESFEINPESADNLQNICPNTDFYIGDAATEMYKTLSDHIDLLYLDSFDAFRDTSVIPAPVHYMLEFCAAWPWLSSGSLVAIDDFSVGETAKGQAVDLFLGKIGAKVLYSGYQKVWQI